MRLCLAVLGCLPVLACADPAAAPAHPPATPFWLVVAEGGYIHSADLTNGSSQTTSARLSVTHTGPYWINIVSTEALCVSNDVPVSSHPERYLASYRARHFFDSRDYFAYRNQWEKDLVSPNDYQAFSSLNVGRELFKTPAGELKLELGAGLRYTAVRRDADQTESIGLLSWEYLHNFTKDSILTQKGGIEDGTTEKIFRASTQLKQFMTSTLALTLNLDFKKVRGENATRESVTSIGVSYRFRT